MSIIDISVRTITCNTCDKTATFNMKEHQQALKDNVWLGASRVVQTGDGRNFVYCSDECEVAGISGGKHNLIVPKKIVEVESGDSQAVKIAANAAKQAEEATKAIKSGKPTKLQVVKG